MARADTNNTIDLLKEIKRQARHHHGDHRTRHARGVQPRRADHRAGPGHPAGRGHAREHQGPPEGARSLSREGRTDEPTAEKPETGRKYERPDFSKEHQHGKNANATAPGLLLVWDMHAYYGESYIVQGVSFNVHEGEILALLGRNGAGKTSTLRAIARIGSPQVTMARSGSTTSRCTTDEEPRSGREGLGLVPEDRRIIPGLTVEENLQLAQIAPPIGWSIERIYDLFPRLGERRKQEGVTLSGGEQQMLAIAGRWRATSRCCCWTNPTRASPR
jgi:ABC-type glutathione transport system ATPase component